MLSAVLNDCSIDCSNVVGCDETPPPELTTGALVFVGLGVTTFVGAGLGVFVGCGVAVGAGVLVGRGVAVGCGVFVGGTGVLVGTAVAVGGTDVAVGGSVGTTVGAGAGVADAQAANKPNIKLKTTNLPDSFNISSLLNNDPAGLESYIQKRGDISP